MDETPNDNKNNDSNDVNDIYNNIYKVVSAEDIKKIKTLISPKITAAVVMIRKRKVCFVAYIKCFQIYVFLYGFCLFVFIWKSEKMKL